MPHPGAIPARLGVPPPWPGAPANAPSGILAAGEAVVLRDDYIVRLIEQLADVLRKLLATLRDEPGRVEAQADETLRALAGIDLGTARVLPLPALLVLLRRGAEVDPARTLIIAEVLRAQAEADAALGLERRARDEQERVARAAALLAELAEEPLAAEVAARLVGYRERQGRLAEAEDALFELLRADPPRAAEIGVPFFGRLQLLSDADLAAGGLPREELEDDLTELQEATNRQNRRP
jgi:hypothetical protein